MYYRRKLPHWHPEGAAIFLTWRLHGSLPVTALKESAAIPAGQAFVAQDRALDHAQTGPRWLTDPRIARVVADSLHFAERELNLYRLEAWVIMPNHVRVILVPMQPVARITGTVKGFTARAANRILGLPPGPFWQHESYDHWVRDREELARIVRYIEWNPVRAGLVASPGDWAWSSAANKAGAMSHSAVG